jgi:hypothetical protein
MSHTVTRAVRSRSNQGQQDRLGECERGLGEVFRHYHAHCVSPDRDTLFSLLEAGHSLNDRLRTGADLDFFGVPEFTSLKCLRNYFHHHQELRHVVRVIPIAEYPGRDPSAGSVSELLAILSAKVL